METREEQIEYGGYCTPHHNAIGTPGGYDIMCHECEMGYTEPYEVERYRMFWSLGDSAPMDMNVTVHAWDDEPMNFDEYWERINARITRIAASGIPLEEWTLKAGIATWVVADSYTEFREPTTN